MYNLMHFTGGESLVSLLKRSLKIVNGPRGSKKLALVFQEQMARVSKKFKLLEIHEANGFLSPMEETIEIGGRKYLLGYRYIFSMGVR